jgi:thiamine-monophosphate kinase
LELGASAAIDVSDGLLRDLGHICEESGVGAEVFMDKIPVSDAATATARELGEDAAAAAMHGGEDFELILVADEDRVAAMRDEIGLAVIGRITEGESVAVLDPSGRQLDVQYSGYEHFKEG